MLRQQLRTAMNAVAFGLTLSLACAETSSAQGCPTGYPPSVLSSLRAPGMAAKMAGVRFDASVIAAAGGPQAALIAARNEGVEIDRAIIGIKQGISSVSNGGPLPRPFSGGNSILQAQVDALAAYEDGKRLSDAAQQIVQCYAGQAGLAGGLGGGVGGPQMSGGDAARRTAAELIRMIQAGRRPDPTMLADLSQQAAASGRWLKEFDDLQRALGDASGQSDPDGALSRLQSTLVGLKGRGGDTLQAEFDAIANSQVSLSLNPNARPLAEYEAACGPPPPPPSLVRGPFARTQDDGQQEAWSACRSDAYNRWYDSLVISSSGQPGAAATVAGLPPVSRPQPPRVDTAPAASRMARAVTLPFEHVTPRGSPREFYKQLHGELRWSEAGAQISIAVLDVDRNWLTTDECVTLDITLQVSLNSETPGGQRTFPLINLTVQAQDGIAEVRQPVTVPPGVPFEVRVTQVKMRACGTAPTPEPTRPPELPECSDYDARLSIIDSAQTRFKHYLELQKGVDDLSRDLQNLQDEMRSPTSSATRFLLFLNMLGASSQVILGFAGAPLPVIAKALSQGNSIARFIEKARESELKANDYFKLGKDLLSVLDQIKVITLNNALKQLSGLQALEDSGVKVLEYEALRTTVAGVTTTLERSLSKHRAQLAQAKFEVDNLFAVVQQMRDWCEVPPPSSPK